ncbi:hypothetical protein D3C72_1868720 [compost metagenome]
MKQARPQFRIVVDFPQHFGSGSICQRPAENWSSCLIPRQPSQFLGLPNHLCRRLTDLICDEVTQRITKRIHRNLTIVRPRTTQPFVAHRRRDVSAELVLQHLARELVTKTPIQLTADVGGRY